MTPYESSSGLDINASLLMESHNVKEQSHVKALKHFIHISISNSNTYSANNLQCM